MRLGSLVCQRQPAKYFKKLIVIRRTSSTSRTVWGRQSTDKFFPGHTIGENDVYKNIRQSPETKVNLLTSGSPGR